MDYVRLYQGPDTAERFETTFADTVPGWQRVTVPFGDGLRPAVLTSRPAHPTTASRLDDVWGYGFESPVAGRRAGWKFAFDLVTVDPKPKPAEVTVTNLKNSGDGSLRAALEEVATGERWSSTHPWRAGPSTSPAAPSCQRMA